MGDAAPAPADEAPLRVLVVETRPITRIGLETILRNAGLYVTASCATLAEAVTQATAARCDVALVGLTADATAAAAIDRLRATSRLEVVVMTDELRAADTRAAIRSGAAGQIDRDAPPARIIAAVRAAAAGLTTVDREVVGALLGRDTGRPEAEGEPAGERATLERGASDQVTGTLSARERELLRYLAEGYTNKEIARVMVLAEDTVKKGVQMLIAKLGAADRTHAVVLAMRSGLLE